MKNKNLIIILLSIFLFAGCEDNDGVDTCGNLVEQYQRLWENKDNLTQEQIDLLRVETKRRFEDAGCDITPLQKFL